MIFPRCFSGLQVKERVGKKYNPSPGLFVAPTERDRDVILIGGGHNALVAAAYLARKGLDVLVLERREVRLPTHCTETHHAGPTPF